MPSLVVRSDEFGHGQSPEQRSQGHKDDEVAIIAPREAPTSELTKRNRRKGYLDSHPEYFSTLELADPLLYDQCVRRFLTAEEREAEGRAKGYSGVLMSDICRTEAKHRALAEPTSKDPLAYPRGLDGSFLEDERNDAPASKEEGLEIWHRLMTWRFLRGDDQDFDYGDVDLNESHDYLAEQQRDLEEQYYREQSPNFDVNEDSLQSQTGIQDF